jgi:ABC-type transporter MlaC component
MKNAARKLSKFAMLLATLVLALGSKPDDPATSAVRVTLVRAEEVAALEATRAKKLEMLRSLSREMFDTTAMAKFAIGDAINSRSVAEREEFFEIFDVFIVRAYLQKLLFFREPRFGFAPPQIKSDYTLVRTAVIAEALGGSDVGTLVLPVVNEDKGPVAEVLLESLRSRADVVEVDREEAMRLVAGDKIAPAALVIPRKTSKRYLGSLPSTLTLPTDPARGAGLCAVQA